MSKTFAIDKIWECVAWLIESKQAARAQPLIRAFLINTPIPSPTMTWNVMKAFGSDIETNTWSPLPEDIAKWISFQANPKGSVKLHDIMELCKTPGWLDKFDWKYLAYVFRNQLKSKYVDPYSRLDIPEHIWSIIKTAWIK